MMVLENTALIKCPKCGHEYIGPRALLAKKTCPECGYDGTTNNSE